MPGASATPVVPPTPGVTRVRSLADHEVFGFLPYWELANARDAIELDRLTTLAWFGVEAGRNGRLIWKQNGVAPGGAAGWRDPRWRSIMSDAQAKGVRVVLTVERFSWQAGARTATIRLLRNRAARSRLARQIRKELIDSGADGVNLDFEPLPTEVRSQFTSFVRELRSVLDRATDAAGRPPMQITFDVTADIAAYDIAALTADDAADAVFLMAYDFRGASAEYAASHSPLDDPETGFDIRTTVGGLLTVADPAHTILGLPWYGRAWTTRGPEPFSPTRTGDRLTPPSTSWYRDALPIARANGRNYDPVAQTAWTVYVVRKPGCPGCPETWRQVWYDDVDGFGAKVAFAQEQDMRGVGIWALGYSGAYRGLWNVLGIAAGEITDTTPPSGSANLSGGASGTQQGLPVVGGDVTLALEARDRGGSELAFVRIANDGVLDDSGALTNGSMWPATSSVAWSLEDGPVVVPPRARATRAPSGPPPLQPTGSAAPGTSVAPTGSEAPASAPPTIVPSPTPLLQGVRSIFVQWRDVAGNWSVPVAVDVWYAPEGSVMPPATPTPPPPPSPSAAPSVAAPTPRASIPGSPGAHSPEPSELLESATAG
jgi:spore germination protein YaaH